LKEFVESYEGYKSWYNENNDAGRPWIIYFELVDKTHFVHIGLAHSPVETIIYEEVGVYVVCMCVKSL